MADIGGYGTSGVSGSQIIGGQTYQQYTPEWYAAQRANNTTASGAAGQAAGSYTNNYLNSSGILNGLQGALGNGAGGSGSASSTPTGTTLGGALGSGSGVNGGNIGPVSTNGNYVAPIQAPDSSTATNSAFATAKDQAGKAARAGLMSLNGELGAQGLMGSGAQVQGTRDIVAQGLGTIGQASRDEAGKAADVAAQFAQTGYQGAITQRGQDVAAQEANARLAFAQQQAAYQRNIQLAQLALGGLTAASSASNSSTSPTGNPIY